MGTTGQTSLEYFAATDDPIKLADSMITKITEWRNWCEGRGLIQLWKKKLRNYYGNSMSGNSSQAISKGGTEGELSLMKVNDFRALIQDQLVTVTSQRPAGVAKAINSDTKSLKAARIGTAVCEYYMVEEDFESKFVNAAEISLVCDESFVDVFWDKGAGTSIGIDPETGDAEKSGDVVVRIHCSWNAARDPGTAVQDIKWYILSYRMNKFDAAKLYPQFSDHIISAQDDMLPDVPMNALPDGSDMIWVHLLVHDRTPAVPSGRYSLLIGNRIVLDTKMPYDKFPIERMTAADVIDGCLGYAPSTDILAMEEATDALHSIITSNQTTFGGQCIVGPLGANINFNDLGKGLRYFELPPDIADKLRSLQLTQTPPEIFNYIGLLSQKKERAVGSVSGVLSQQAAQGASGSAMALIQTQSISYNSGTQRSYFKLLSGTMTKLISVLRTYADTPRIARIVGKSKASGLKQFKYTGEDLDSVSSIVYELVSPVSQTFGGRITMGQDLLKAGQIKSPKQYVNLITTGQLEVLTQDDESDGFLILEENDAMTDGMEIDPVITEIHEDHIKSHNSLITLDAKLKDPGLIQRVLAHNQKHIDLWSQASMQNPAILIATKQQPLPPPPPPPGMMGPPGPGIPQGAPPPQVHGPGPGVPQMVGGPGAPVEHKADEVKKPNLPNIAGTKEKPVIPGVPS